MKSNDKNLKLNTKLVRSLLREIDKEGQNPTSEQFGAMSGYMLAKEVIETGGKLLPFEDMRDIFARYNDEQTDKEMKKQGMMGTKAAMAALRRMEGKKKINKSDPTRYDVGFYPIAGGVMEVLSDEEAFKLAAKLRGEKPTKKRKK